MEFEQTWIKKKAVGHNFILFDKKVLYRRQVKKADVPEVERELNKGIISDGFIGLPVSYMTRVEYRDDNHSLNINYGSDSEDSIKIQDQLTRKQVFDFLKSNTLIKHSFVKKPGVFARIKKPFIALLVVLGIFAYVYYIMQGLSQGYEYEIVGGRARGGGLAGLVLVLADLGMAKNLMIFSPLALIALYRIRVNLKNDSDIHVIEY